ncbi:MAG TPA: thiamine phosphate synthase [Terriglobales bacterium]|nr:thiamine phosphate synthase [Terriglobales bacterium]
MLLYYITDRQQLGHDEGERRRRLLGKIEEAACAGVDYIQLRERDLTTRELETLAREVVEVVRSCRGTTRLLVNSRTDVAIAVGAAGVHLRSEDVSPADVRGVFEQAGLERPVVAVSCHSLADVEAAEVAEADFVVFGPVFGKMGSTAVAGTEALRAVCHRGANSGASRPIPVVALGGVTLQNAAACLAAGAAGVAAIRMFQENEVARVVGALREL